MLINYDKPPALLEDSKGSTFAAVTRFSRRSLPLPLEGRSITATMIAFVLRRVLQAVLVMLVVGFVAFSLFQYVGDPVAIMLGQDATPEDRMRLTRDLGLDQPFFVQFGHFVANAVRGEFGISYRLSRPVASLIAERLPPLELSATAALFALAIGVPMGSAAALRPRPAYSVFMTASLIGVALPTFLIGIF
jgi:peptide/nickel transport system permease protein